MATFGGLALDLTGSGVVLLTAKPLKHTRTYMSRSGDVRTMFETGSSVVRVESRDPRIALDDVPRLLRDDAEEALDLLSLRGLGGFILTTPDPAVLAWSGGTGNVTLRAFDHVSQTITASVGDQPDAAHRSRENSQPAKVWHESFRYFRMSQSTDDLLDAFRNIYLALENLLTALVPPVAGEREKQWLPRALRQIETDFISNGRYLTFDQRLLEPPAAPPFTDAVDAMVDELYNTARNAAFHAKENHPITLPQRQADRDQVARVMERYVNIYTDLVSMTYGVGFQRGYVGKVVADSYREMFLSFDYFLSQRPYTDDEDIDGLVPETGIAMAVTSSPAYDSDFYTRGVLLTVSADSVPAGYLVRGATGVERDTRALMIGTDLKGALDVAGVSRFEYLLQVAMRGRGCRTDYPT